MIPASPTSTAALSTPTMAKALTSTRAWPSSDNCLEAFRGLTGFSSIYLAHRGAREPGPPEENLGPESLSYNWLEQVNQLGTSLPHTNHRAILFSRGVKRE